MSMISPRLLLVAGIATSALLAPRTGSAQFGILPQSAYRGWNVCFTSAIGTCTELFVGADVRSSLSVVSSVVRHHSVPGTASGLMAFSWHLAGATRLQSDFSTTACLGALGNAPLPPGSECAAWRMQSVSSSTAPNDPAQNYLSYSSTIDPTWAQFIGGCDGSTFDDVYAIVTRTCGGGAYEMLAFSNLSFTSTMVAGISLDIYSGDQNDDGLPDQASCFIDLRSGDPGVGIDLGDPTTVAGCTATPISTVPEPASMLLLGTGLALLTAARRRRSRT